MIAEITAMRAEQLPVAGEERAMNYDITFK
jgi:hypothetical protein